MFSQCFCKAIWPARPLCWKAAGMFVGENNKSTSLWAKFPMNKKNNIYIYINWRSCLLQISNYNCQHNGLHFKTCAYVQVAILSSAWVLQACLCSCCGRFSCLGHFLYLSWWLTWRWNDEWHSFSIFILQWRQFAWLKWRCVEISQSGLNWIELIFQIISRPLVFFHCFIPSLFIGTSMLWLWTSK